MAEDTDPEERTEMPTERRMSQLRRDGAIYMSNEIVLVSTLVTGFIVLGYSWRWFVNDLKVVFTRAFTLIGENPDLNPIMVRHGVLGLIRLIGPHMLFVVVIISAVASLSVMLQTNWNIKEHKFDFRPKFLDPIAGIKRIFSIGGFVSTLKAFVKLACILPVGFIGLKHFAPDMIMLVHLNISQIFAFTGTAMVYLFWRIFWILFIIAIIDWVWGRHQWLRLYKMTKAEVKDERKAIEGDEETKKKIQNKGFQRIIQRIRSTVPKADVIVTNPTHFAVALQYDRKTMSAPIVIAKGKDFLAQRIKEIARESNVPILERKILARALFDSTEVGSQIPYELFKAVAEVLAYVYRLKNPNAATITQKAAEHTS